MIEIFSYSPELESSELEPETIGCRIERRAQCGKADSRAEGNVQGRERRHYGEYSFSSRFEEGDGSNPEELLAAAHAACFSMALSGQLEGNGTPPTRVETNAVCTVEKVGAGFKITTMRLTTRAKVAEHRRREVPGARERGQGRMSSLAGAQGKRERRYWMRNWRTQRVAAFQRSRHEAD